MKNKREQVYHKSSVREAEKANWQDLYGSSIGLAIASMNPKFIPRGEPRDKALGGLPRGEKRSSSPLDKPGVHTTGAVKNLIKPLLIITPDLVTSSQIEQEVRFFMGKNGKNIQILSFPGWETLPYDHFSPHEDVVSDRLLTLYQLSILRSGIIFIDAPTLMHKLSPKKYVEANSFVLKTDETIDPENLHKKLENRGYTRVNKVMEHGEFAVRGSIIDIFPMGSKTPFRIDLLDDDVDSIRVFDPDTQLSVKNINNIKILPAKEFPLDEAGINKFSTKWRDHFYGNPLKCPMYNNITSHKNHPGIEYYLPLFFDQTATFFDYIPENSTVITIGDIEKNMRHFWDEIEKRHEQLSHDITHPILKPQEIFINPEKISELTNSFSQLLINPEKLNKPDNKSPLSLCFKSKKDSEILQSDKIVEKIPAILERQKNLRALFIAESAGRRETLLETLKSVNLNPTPVTSWKEFIKSSDKTAITTAQVENPLHITLEKSNAEILIITEAQIYGSTITQSRRDKLSKRKTDAILHDLTEMQVGSPVVHIDYGVGRYLGLEKLTTDGLESEFLVLEYANHAKLYVPVTSFELISKYTGTDPDHTPLNHLGSKQWEKVKRVAQEKIRDTAVELLEIYAKRSASKGYKFIKPQAEYEKFLTTFPFVATQDQDRAIEEVISDMTSGRSMDRLICGDVGFGKTEVAMRAAFLAAYNSKQVAILVPTTLLAQQHFDNFQDRFSSCPVKLALFSRFRSTKDQKKIIENLANGKIDIVIGTHKLLGKTIKFKNLGLLIIDEEHRFGVRQKEQIKKIAADIDILSLTATPIPRTLNMAFAGIRDFSIISTPPAKRLAIKTFIHEYESRLIKEAILRETLRGGQVYFLHNNVKTIEKTARELQDLVPNIKVAIAHGQMRKRELESIMRDFYHLKTNVLVCTTIIESGLDVPTANTIIINRADRFGLAQLHQIRGRVGRSHHQAYAYLIIPHKSVLTADAKKRLDAIAAMKDLGAGFILATHDLEIRGAGELLGEKQSGVMHTIGFDLYMNMLEKAVKTLKKNKGIEIESPPETKTEIELQISALIPEKYVISVNSRLILYKKIAVAKNQEELDEIQVEMIDRFGVLPEQVKTLIKIAALKLRAQQLGITKITIGKDKGVIEFAKDCSIDPTTIVKTISKHSNSCKFSGPYSIQFSIDPDSSKLDFVEKLLASSALCHTHA